MRVPDRCVKLTAGGVEARLEPDDRLGLRYGLAS
jgi:hypothetical protein